MTELLPLGLAFVVGLIFGYSVCLWRWCSADMLTREPDTEPGLRQCVAEHAPMSPTAPSGFYRQQAVGGPIRRLDSAPYATTGATFGVVHDCLRDRCKAPHRGEVKPRALSNVPPSCP
jgi:hypothetical protein